MSDYPVLPPQSNNIPTGDDALAPSSLAPAYVFEATDPSDTDAVRDAMAQSAAVGEEVQAYRRLFNAMLHATPAAQPPPAVGEKLLRAIQPPITPIVQRYPGASASIDPLEAMQVVSLITPPGGSNAIANDRVNPITGKPVSASVPPAKNQQKSALASIPQKSQPKPASTPAPKATPYPPKGALKATTQSKNQTQYATVRPPVGKRTEPIPAGFALTPIAPAGAAAARSSRVGLWAAWGLALAAVTLLFASNGYWVTQSAQLQQQSAQLHLQNTQLQSDTRSAQEAATTATNNLAVARQQLDDRETELAALRGSLAATQAELTAAQSELVGARTQVADAVAALEQVRDQSGGMAISDGMVDVLVRGPMEQASLATLDASQTMSATARILWNPEMERGMLVAMEMPPLPDGQAYQVWLLRAGVPTSIGMFTVDDKGMGMLEVNGMDLTDYEVAAITTEPMTGSEAPTGAILIAGEL